MTVESNCVITLAMLSDWLKRLVPVSQPIATCTCDLSRALSELRIISRNCDWCIALTAVVVIGRSNCFFFGFLTVV